MPATELPTGERNSRSIGRPDPPTGVPSPQPDGPDPVGRSVMCLGPIWLGGTVMSGPDSAERAVMAGLDSAGRSVMAGLDPADGGP